MENLTEYIGYIVGAVGSAFGIYFSQYRVRKVESDAQVKLAQLNVQERDIEKMEDTIATLKLQVKELNDERIAFENRLQAVKKTFRIVINQYKRMFSNDSEKLAMMEELSVIIDEL